jgi:3-isopropylmalate/(R)-2-methylmalate dehydratase small subunit
MVDSSFDWDELPYLVGRAWTFGDSISAAEILPPEHHDRGLATGSFVMNGQAPSFASRLQRGDFVIAGLQFGHGNAVAATARALKLAGVGAVIARSFGGSFFRHAIYCGLPALQVEETAAVKTGDRLRVDIEGHKVVNLSSGDRYVIRNVYDESLDILRAGGWAEYHAAKA